MTTRPGRSGPQRDPAADGRVIPGQYALIQHWLSIGRPERALEEIARLPGELALSPPAHALRAAALLELGRGQEAARAAEAGLREDEANTGLLAFLAAALHQLGRLADAERVLLSGLQEDPTDVTLLCLYAWVCAAGGQVRKARALVERAASSEPASAQVAQSRLLVELVAGRHRTALRLARRELARDPAAPFGNLAYGMVAASRGDARSAYAALQRVLVAEYQPELVQVLDQVRVYAHPALWIFRPALRFGPVTLWAVAFLTVVVLILFRWFIPACAVLGGWTLYCAYSWVAVPLVRHRTRRRR